MTRRCLWLAGLIVMLSSIVLPTANAYIDPGSSSMILQLLFGALLGVGLAVATFWKRIRAFFTRRSSDKPQ